MTLTEAILRVRKLIRDTDKVGYPDDELKDYINDAIHYVCVERINNGDPQMVREITISDEYPIPTDYFTLAGEYPIYINGDVFKLYNTAEPVTIRYNALCPTVSVGTDNIPFKDIYNGIVCRVASIYALNRNEFTVTQDMNIIAMSMNGIKEAQTK